MARLVLDQNVSAICSQISEPLRVVPLDDGGLLVADLTFQYRVVRVTSSGQQQGAAFRSPSHFPVAALCVLQDTVFILQLNGTLLSCPLSDLSRAAHTYKVVESYGVAGGDVIDKDTVVFTDLHKGTVSTYNLTTKQRDLVVSGLNGPYSVEQGTTKEGPVFVLTERNSCQVHVYDQAWGRRYSMGGRGSEDGELDDPRHATVSEEGDYILVADYKNRRISKFSLQGEFICHVLTHEDGLDYPLYVTCRNDFVWVTCTETTGAVTDFNLKRFKFVN